MTGPAAFLLVLLSAAAAADERRPVAAPNATDVVGAPNGPPLSGDALDATTKEVASLLRCPVCQGSSVWDSPATMAVNMKHKVRELLADGYDQGQILLYFENSYGEFVLLAPSKKGIGLLVWVLPVVLLIAGGFIVWRVVCQAPAVAGESRILDVEIAPTELPGREMLPADPALAKYVLAVRDLAYGRPQANSPTAARASEVH